MVNRNPISQWFSTFPQSGTVSKEVYLGSWPPHSYAVIGTESHSDGNAHLHLLIKLKKPLSRAKLVAWLTAKYPEDWKRICADKALQTAKDMADVRDYILKEDPHALIVGGLVKRDKYMAERAFFETLDNSESMKAIAKREQEAVERAKRRQADYLERKEKIQKHLDAEYERLKENFDSLVIDDWKRQEYRRLISGMPEEPLDAM